MLKKSSRIKEEIITIPTFTKLLPIRIVAKSFLGSESKLSIRSLFLLFSSFKFSFWVFDNPKIATSDPERKADNNISIKIQNILKPELMFWMFKINNGLNK